MAAWILRLHTHDERALHALLVRRCRLLNHIMRGLTHAGDAWFTIGVTMALLLAPDAAIRAAGLCAACALTSSHLVVQLLKHTISRPRPHLPFGCVRLAEPPDHFSFPSGHAAASLSVALGLMQILPGGVGAVLACVALVAGVSRCYLGVHYPGDVIAGWGLALMGNAAGLALVG